MSKSYKITTRTLTVGDMKGQTVYNVRPVSYGTLTSEDAAKQISVESSLTPADVKAVLDRYAYYVKENLRKGYDIELLGFGYLHLRFITKKSVTDKKLADTSLIKRIVPGFRPSYSAINNTRMYDLVPEKISLVKYGDADAAEGNNGKPDEGVTEPEQGNPGGEGTDETEDGGR